MPDSISNCGKSITEFLRLQETAIKIATFLAQNLRAYAHRSFFRSCSALHPRLLIQKCQFMNMLQYKKLNSFVVYNQTNGEYTGTQKRQEQCQPT